MRQIETVQLVGLMLALSCGCGDAAAATAETYLIRDRATGLENLGPAASAAQQSRAAAGERLKLERVGTSASVSKRNGALSGEPSACQLVPVVHLLHHPGCQPKAIASFACSGSCRSYVKTSTSDFWQRERSCSCCQRTGSQEATFALDCPSLEPPYRKVKTRAPVECLCRACTDLGREDLRAQELVEALASEANGGFDFKSS